MQNLEDHVSPDGRLRFLIFADRDGDLTLGFDGYSWHTHADILASISGLAQTVAVRRFVDNLINDRSVIAILTIPGEIGDAWVTEEPASDANYPIEGETIELRYWSGRPWSEKQPQTVADTG
ncbi:hypothetical protein EP7_003015 [Isosphaeraceae bacterium EP7]